MIETKHKKESYSCLVYIHFWLFVVARLKTSPLWAISLVAFCFSNREACRVWTKYGINNESSSSFLRPSSCDIVGLVDKAARHSKQLFFSQAKLVRYCWACGQSRKAFRNLPRPLNEVIFGACASLTSSVFHIDVLDMLQDSPTCSVLILPSPFPLTAQEVLSRGARLAGKQDTRQQHQQAAAYCRPKRTSIKQQQQEEQEQQTEQQCQAGAAAAARAGQQPCPRPLPACSAALSS